jgi:hypothetical protein
MQDVNLQTAYTTEDVRREALAAHSAIKDDLASMATPDFVHADLSISCNFIRIGQLNVLTRNWINVPETDTAHPEGRDDAVDWAIRWMTAPRSEQNIKNIMLSKCLCEVSPDIRDSHFFGRMVIPGPHKTPGFDLVYTCSSILADYLSDGQIARYNFVVDSGSRSQNVDALPYGVCSSLSSLVGWLNGIEYWLCRDTVITCIDLLLEISHSISLPQLALQPRELMRGLVTTIHGARIEWFNDRSQPSGSKPQSLYNRVAETISKTALLLNTIMNYSLPPLFEKIVDEADHPPLVATCCSGYMLAKDLEHLRSRNAAPGFQYLHPNVLPNTALIYALFASKVVDISPELLETSPICSALDMPETVKGYLIGHLPQPTRDFCRLERIIAFLVRCKMCQRAGCHQKATSTGSNLRECKGCRCVYYCSRRCQKAAWVDPLAAHRDVCWVYLIMYRRLSLSKAKTKKIYDRTLIENLPWAAITTNAAALHYVVKQFYRLVEHHVNTTITVNIR